MKIEFVWLAALLAAAVPAAQAQQPAASAPAAVMAPSSPAKKELVQRLLVLQQGAIEGLSRGVIERPLAQLMQRAGNVLQIKVPPEKREAVAKSMEADVRQFVDEAVPLLRDRALKIAPATYGAMLEEKFTEDELRQFVAWLESPVSRKFQQYSPDMQTALVQKLGTEADSLLGAKLQALERKLAATLGVPTSPAEATSGPRPAASKPKASR